MSMVARLHGQLKKVNITQLAKYSALSTLALQGLAIATVLGIDEIRKRRNPPAHKFPHSSPRTTQVGESEVTLYTFGRDLYQQMIDDIRNAKSQVLFETFIIKNDNIGCIFRDAIIEAAARGVDVYVVIDAWGTLNQPLRVRRFPIMENIHVKIFPLFRPGILTGNIRNTGRDHRKLLVVDEQIGYIGGYNIGDLYASKWRDTHIRVAGPDVWELKNSFVDFWNDMGAMPPLADDSSPSWNGKIRAVQNRPSKVSFPVRSMYLDTLDRASKKIWLTTAYFVPDREIRNALVKAVNRGVDVRVIVPQYSNHIVCDWVSSSLYNKLLQNGVRIFLYQNAMVHAKSMTVDGTWSTVGTANLDRLSLAGNFEVNVSINSAKMAQLLEETFQRDLTNCVELTWEKWAKRRFGQRLIEKILSPLAPLV